MSVWDDYAKKANTIAKHHPAPLVGPTKTRREAMARYSEIVAEIGACGDADQLDCYLASISKDIAQFQAELPFLWRGDGADFPGLEGEIEQRFEEFRVNPESEAERLFGHLEEEVEI